VGAVTIDRTQVYHGKKGGYAGKLPNLLFNPDYALGQALVVKRPHKDAHGLYGTMSSKRK
jgi:hypothetical protein